MTKRDRLARSMRRAYALFVDHMISGRITEEERNELDDAIAETRLLLHEQDRESEETSEEPTTEMAPESFAGTQARRHLGRSRKR